MITEISADSGRYFGSPVAATSSATPPFPPNPTFYQEVGTSPKPSKAGGTLLAPLQVAMDIRIDTVSEGPEVIFHVAGRLTGTAISQLEKVCEPMEGHYVLDLSKLKFADDAGAEAIRALRKKGAGIRGASSFIRLLINGDTG